MAAPQHSTHLAQEVVVDGVHERVDDGDLLGVRWGEGPCACTPQTHGVGARNTLGWRHGPACGPEPGGQHRRACCHTSPTPITPHSPPARSQPHGSPMRPHACCGSGSWNGLSRVRLGLPASMLAGFKPTFSRSLETLNLPAGGAALRASPAGATGAVTGAACVTSDWCSDWCSLCDQ